MEGQKNKIKTKNGYTLVALAIIIVVAILILLLVVVFFGAGIAAWWNSRGEVSPNINCETWADAPAGYQDKITAAANKAGIQPALLGAIFLSEHNNNWTSVPDSNDQGPFQIPNKSDYAGFLSDAGFKISSVGRTDWWNDFDTAAYAAALDLKNGFKWANKPTNSSDEKAIVFAGLWYNTGPVAAQEWANAGYNLDVSPPSKPDWGNAGTQQYAKRTWTNFQKLNLGCKSYAPSAGGSFIQACQGSTASGGGGSVIVIDPGHGTPNNHAGAVGEAAVNLKVALVVREQLVSAGYTVFMTRGDPNGGGIDTSAASGNNDQQSDEDNKRRALFANSKGAALMFRIHADDGTAPGYFFAYPTSPGKSRDGHEGPSQDVAQKSEAVTKALSASLASQGIAKKSDPKTDTYGTQYGQNLVGSTWSTVPGSLIEMFGMKSDHANTIDSYKNTIGGAIASAIKSAVPLGGGAQTQTTSTMTPACRVANFALDTALDVKNNECHDGQGCRGNSSEYTGSSSYSKYAKTTLASNLSKYIAFPSQDHRSWADFADCGKFVSYVVRHTVDPNFEEAGTSTQLDYVNEHRDKYVLYSNQPALQPGDIIFRGSCNTAQKDNDENSDVAHECGGKVRGFGHVLIYTGTNNAFKDKTIVEASLGETERGKKQMRGPMANVLIEDSIIVVRVKN